MCFCPGTAAAGPDCGMPGGCERTGLVTREYRSVKEASIRAFRSVAVSTGIGGASAAIAVEELVRIGVRNMIRIGSCGALKRGSGWGT